MSARSSVPAAALLAGLAATVVGVGFTPLARRAAAQPADAPPGVRYVPADAALFVHADADKLYGGPIGQAIRKADPKTFDQLAGQAKALFGLNPDDLRAVTAFWPKLKQPQDMQTLGLVLTFKVGYDKAKLEKGIKEIADGVPFAVHTPSDRTVVVLTNGLGAEYAKPRPAGEAGPLAAALKEAASGKYMLVAGSAPDSLPDEIRGDDLPPDVRPFKSIFRAKAVVGLVSVGREVTVEARVTADTPARAVEAEKSLGLLTKLLQDGLAGLTKELGPAREKDPGLRDVATLLKAADAALKGAKYETRGNEAVARVSVPADLPFGGAYVAAVAKVRGAAARNVSANNLKQIALAMHGYADTYGAFPPAAVVDKEGRPLLSWRVLILPYIEQDNLYKQFKLDEPWDGPNNKKLLAKMPKVYAMPEKAAPDATTTYYRVFTGRGAAFDLLQGVKLPAGFPDGTSNTLLVATAAEAVPWSKPDELPFDPDADMTKLLGFFTNGVCNVAYADGSVRGFKKTVKPQTLNLVIQRDDGMVIPDLDD
ncbi:MAG: DUF1559 domain-containing protein [Gemmataceae bacterium]|nr:DUF1559 domain-containing protein [Gemmataceae bacterium]